MDADPIAAAVIMVPVVLVCLALIWLLEHASEVARKRRLARDLRRRYIESNSLYRGGKL